VSTGGPSEPAERTGAALGQKTGHRSDGLLPNGPAMRVCKKAVRGGRRPRECDNRARMTLTKKGETRPAPASWGLAARGGIPWEYAPLAAYLALDGAA
jgi:hypothetical protein